MSDTASPGGPPGRSAFRPPRKVPPPNRAALQQAVERYAEYHGLAPNRVQRWIAFMVLGGALARISSEEGEPTFLIKGGVALELRLGVRARATRDFDALFRRDGAEILQALEQAFSEPYAGFTLRVGGEPLVLHRMTRFEIKVGYQGRVWSSIPLEVSQDEGTPLPAEEVPAFHLADFGLSGPQHLPCLPLVKQVAQKIHALTEPVDQGRPTDRFRDLLDLWIIRDMAPPSRELREVCEETFRVRDKHSWPPTIVVLDHWHGPFQAMTAEVQASVRDANQAAGDVQEYIQRIADS